MSYYYWFIIKPTHEHPITSLIAGLNPISSSIESLHSGGYSCLVQTDTYPGNLPEWKSSIHYLSFLWVNEVLLNRSIPFDASCLSRERLNRLVEGYSLTYANQLLNLL